MDDPMNDIAALVLSLPEPARSWVITTLAFVVGFALLLNGAKALALKLGWKPDPNPPQWKRIVFRALDYIALNGTPLLKLVELRQKDQQIAHKDEALRRSVPALSIQAGPMNREEP